MSHRSAVFIFAAALAFVLTGPGCPSRQSEPVPHVITPRLVVLIVVDQLIPQRVDPVLPGGIGRLAREGRVFSNAKFDHAFTETCPGHAVLLTGVQPARAGIPGNRFILGDSLDVSYCIEDASAQGRLLSWSTPDGQSPRAMKRQKPQNGRSPKNLKVEALGDWLKAADPRSRVFAVSAKDRAAVMLGGQRPDGAFWLDRKGTGAFTSSHYYMATMPEWASRWDRSTVLSGLPRNWDYEEVTFDESVIRDDSYRAESDRFGVSGPHPLVAEGDLDQSLSPVEASPYLDTKTLAFVRDLVENENLGQDEWPDLLAISLSATDIVGHLYGPYSREAWAALVKLDADLAVFLGDLEHRVGRDRLLVALTADHGVLPLPEWWATHGGADQPCPVAGGRISTGDLDAAVTTALVEELGEPWGRAWVRESYTFGFDGELARDRGISLDRVARVAQAALAKLPAVVRVWTPAEAAAESDGSDMARQYANSLAEGLGGQLIVQPQSGCLFTDWESGTSHGSPYGYDTRVPLVIWGGGVEPGLISTAVGPVDLAPTLAEKLGVPVPLDVDGRVLPLRSLE